MSLPSRNRNISRAWSNSRSSSASSSLVVATPLRSAAARSLESDSKPLGERFESASEQQVDVLGDHLANLDVPV